VTAAALLRSVVRALDTTGIPFMLTGSLAAAYHGAGRATMDVDVVIDPTASQLNALVKSLAAPGIYVSHEAATDALAHRSMFNVIDVASGWKADLIIRKHRPFSEHEFRRRREGEYEGCPLWVTSVEDLIVAKLEWAKLGASARQLEDVAELLRLHDESLDHAYLDRWIGELGLSGQWQTARGLGTRDE
jgi:hypothetical protein